MSGLKLEVHDTRVLRSFERTISNNIVECEQSKKNTWYPGLKPNIFGDYYEAMVDIINEDIKKIEPYFLTYHTIKSFILEQSLVTQQSLQIEDKQVENKMVQTEIEFKKEQFIQTDIKFIKEQATQIKIDNEDVATQTKSSKDLNLIKKDYSFILNNQYTSFIKKIINSFNKIEVIKYLSDAAKVKHEYYVDTMQDQNQTELLDEIIISFEKDCGKLELMGQELSE
jgi:hypothetical protein